MQKGKPPERAGRKARELKRPFSRRHARPAAIYSNSQLNFIEKEKGIMAKRRALKKLLSLTMALSLAMSLLNVSVFAADGDETAHQHNQMTCPACDGEGYESAPCSACGGTGTVTNEVSCPDCNGEGQYYGWSFDYPCPICNEKGCQDNPNCYFGYELRWFDCETCGATGTAIEKTDCTACNGTGIQLTEESCATCSGTGKVDCTGEFAADGLTVAADGTGVQTYVCETCGDSYEVTLTAEEVAQLLAQGLEITYEVSKDSAAAGDTLTYELTIQNTNSANVENITAAIQFDTGLVYSATNFSGAKLDTETNTLHLSAASLDAGKTLTAKITVKVADDAEKGSDLSAALSVSMGDTPVTQDALSVHINKYSGTQRVYLNGFQMGLNYDSAGRDSQWAAEAVSSSETKTLDQLEQNVKQFTFAQLYEAGFTRNYAEDMADGVVTNLIDGLTWTCVGFVHCPKSLSYSGSLYNVSDLADYIYTEDGTDDFTAGTLEDAQAAIEAAGGVLYGESNPDAISAFLKNLESNINGNCAGMICVWYVEPKDPIEQGDYADPLTIPAVKAVDYQPTSQGVTFSVGDVTYHDGADSDFVVADVTITIDSSAPNDLNINLNDALTQAMEAISQADGYNQVQPGDVMTYLNITVDNQSGRTYRYTDGSMAIGTVPMNGDGTLGTGFEGYTITGPVEEDGTAYSYIPWRVWNAPLQDLGLRYNQLDDVTVGKALSDAGYAVDGLTNDGSDAYYTQIARECLSHYYLDYFNQTSSVDSFDDLTTSQLAILTNTPSGTGTFIAELETSPEVAEALYYFYYARAYTFWGVTADSEGAQTSTAEQSLYAWMADQQAGSSELEAMFQEALTNGTSFSLVTQLDSQAANNGFQNTKFGFGMQFQMYARTSGGGSSSDYYDVTVNYYDQDGNVIHSQYVSNDIREGRSWDVTDRQLDTITYNGVTYTFDRAEGDPLSGTNIRADKVIDLYYTAEGEDIPDPEVPEGELPTDPTDPGTTDPTDPTQPGGGTDLEDPDVPTAEVPETGDTSLIWAAAALLSGIGLAWLAISGKKREENA